MDKLEALPKYREYIAQNPGDRDNARKSFFDTFGVDPEAAPKTPFQKQAAARKLGIEVQQNAATMEQDIADARTTAAKQLSAAIPVAESLFTGGLTMPAAMGLMGASGAAGGAIGQGVALGTGSTDAPKSGMELVKNLGVDALWGTLGEGTGRAVVPAMNRR